VPPCLFGKQNRILIPFMDSLLERIPEVKHLLLVYYADNIFTTDEVNRWFVADILQKRFRSSLIVFLGLNQRIRHFAFCII
jgi:hypothetical protein